MPGINLTGKAQTKDYKLGRGRVYLGDIDTTTGRAKGYRLVGNSPGLTVTVETEKLEHVSSLEGLRTIDKELTVSQKMNLSLILDEVNFQNLALFFSGESGTFTNAGGAAIIGASNVTVIRQGEWYDLHAGADGTGERIYDIGVVTVSGSAENTDFEVDREMGRIFIVQGGNIVAGPINVDVAANGTAAATLDEVKGLTLTNVSLALKFVEENAAFSNHVTEYQFHQVSLVAEGDLGLISGEEVSQMTLTGAAERNSLADADSPYVTVRTIAA